MIALRMETRAAAVEAGASKTKSKLIMKGKCGWGSEKSWIYAIIFSNIL